MRRSLSLRSSAQHSIDVIADFDPLDPDTLADPYPTFARLREQSPVARSEQYGGFWALTKYADCCAVATDHRTFINSVQNTVPRVRGGGRRPPIHFDPPEHTLYRRAMNAAFRKERILRLEPAVRPITARLLEAMLSDRKVDAMRAFGSPLPIQALALAIGMSAADARQVESLVHAFAAANQAKDDRAARTVSEALMDHARAMVAERRRRPRPPRDDLVASLLAAGSTNSEHEQHVVGAVRHLFVAVHVTLSHAITSCIRHLSGDDRLATELRANPARTPEAVEELLRLYTPPAGFARTATRDVTIRGRVIRQGDVVVLLLPSANRDEEAFDHADQFVLDRRPNKHVAFGRGIHMCLGQQLARLVLRIALEELVLRTASIEVVGAVVPSRWPSIGPAVLPVRLERAAITAGGFGASITAPTAS
jgi:cytochrome P450